MRILSVDPGYDRLGIAVLEKNKDKQILIYSECFSPHKAETQKRMFMVGQQVRKIIKKYNPEILAIENLFFNKNQKTAFLIAEVRGIIIYEAFLSGIEVRQYTPLEVKIAVTGYGRSDKKQISEMVEKLVSINKKGVLKDDEFDAIAVGITCLASEKKLSTR